MPTDSQFREFLLRRMPPEEAARFEEAIVVEDGVAERLRAEEFDLLDDYAGERLTGEDRDRVERYLLASAENIHSVRVSRLLAGEAKLRAGSSNEVPGPTMRPAVVARSRRWTGRHAAIGGLLAAGLAAIMVIPYLDHAPPHGTPAALSPAPEAAAPAPAAVVEQIVPVFTLLAEASRGSQPTEEARPKLLLKAASNSARLEVEVPGPARNVRYSLTVSDASGHSVFAGQPQPVHTAGGYRFIDVLVPLAAVGPGNRTISLRAADAPAGAPAEYIWQVVGILEPSVSNTN